MSYEFLVIIVALNVLATISLWRQVVRKAPRPNKKFNKSLRHTEPITPKHDRPKTIGGDLAFMVADWDRRFFPDFAAFADAVNWRFADKHFPTRWRLQELPDTDLSLTHSDSPDFGRRYDIFYNQERMGRLEVSGSHDYTTEIPKVHVDIEIDSVRLLHYEAVTDFLSRIADHVTDPQNSDERSTAHRSIQVAMTKVLWDNQQISEHEDLDGQDWGTLSVSFHGTATWYIQRKEAFRKL